MVTVIQPDYSETSGSGARFNTRAFWFLRSHPWVPAMKLQISWCPNSTPTRCEPDEPSRATLAILEHISKVSSLLCSYLKKPIYFSSERWEVFLINFIYILTRLGQMTDMPLPILHSDRCRPSPIQQDRQTAHNQENGWLVVSTMRSFIGETR